MVEYNPQPPPSKGNKNCLEKCTFLIPIRKQEVCEI